MDVQNIISAVLITIGAFFVLIGNIGLIRLPDFYSRAHSTGKVDTLATMLIMIGLIVYEGVNLNSAKMLMVLIFVGLTNPTATNALARAAYRAGLRPCFCHKKAGDEKTCKPCNTSEE